MPDSPADRRLPPYVVLQPALGTDELWDRFELFEALHHTMVIANPMADDDLDRVVSLIAPSDGDRVLDVACGYGELLKRLRRRASVDGVGIDLSPWMIQTAANGSESGLQWVLAEARSVLSAADPVGAGVDQAHSVVSSDGWDVACCLGAAWIWYGLHGTIRAMARLVRSGGAIAIGDMHIRPELNPDDVLESHGRVDSMADIDGWFDRYDIDVIERVSISDRSWDDYHDRVDHAAATWPGDGPDGQRWIDEARAWRAAANRDRPVLTWSVWVGRKR